MSKKTSLKKVNTNTGLATRDVKRENVPNFLKDINDRLAALKGEEKDSRRITEELEPFGKISEITDVQELMGAYAYITYKAKGIESFRSVFELNVSAITIPAVTINGHSLERWQEEILTQHRAVTFKQEIEKLEKIRERLTKHLSEDQKFEEDMQDILTIWKA